MFESRVRLDEATQRQCLNKYWFSIVHVELLDEIIGTPLVMPQTSNVW